MRAVVITEKGPALRDIAQPDAKAGQVLVRVRANALNRADLAMAAGHLHGTRGGVGAVMGLEWAGEVEAVGSGVKGLSPGDRVMGSGGFADYLTVPAAQVLRIPDANLSFEEAACFPVALRTMHNIVPSARCRPARRCDQAPPAAWASWGCRSPGRWARPR